MIASVAGAAPAPSFLTWRLAPYGIQSRSIASADFNSDGFDDLAVLNGSRIEVLVADGLGNFSAPTQHLRGGSIGQRLLAADWNGDAAADLALLYGDGDLWFFFGDGQGGFPEQRAVPVGAGPTSMTVADVDGDGDADFLVSLSGGSTTGYVQVVANQGAGVFHATGEPVAAGHVPVRVASGDFDADGHADVAVTNDFVRAVSVLFGDGTGGFGDRLTLQPAPEPTTPGPYPLEAGDVTGDGIDDLVVGNGLFDIITFPPTIPVATAAQIFPSTDTAVYGNVALFPGTGERRFDSPTILPGDNAPREFRLRDIDGDGRRDIVIGGLGGLVMLLARPDGTFTRVGFGIVLGSNVTVGDFNGDRWPDLALSGTAPRADVLLGLGGGRFPVRYALRVNRTDPRDPPHQIGQLATADFNGDGFADLAVPTGQPGSVFAFLGKGDGDFGPNITSQVGRRVSGIAAADFDGDGAVDVMTTGVFDARARPLLLLGDGRGRFTESVRLGTEQSDYGPTMGVADFDEDGSPDLITTITSTPRALVGVELFLGDGQGGFPRTVALPTRGGTEFAVGDLNGDDHADVLLAGTEVDGANSRPELMAYLGRGDGTFAGDAPRPLAMPSRFTRDIALADFDEDGWSDLVITVGGAGRPAGTFWLRGTGHGQFGDPVHLTPEIVTEGALATFIGVLRVADFNGDAHQDIVVANFEGFSVFAGDGQGQFAPFSTAFSISCGDCPLLAADLNGDGLTDLATQSAPSSDLQINLVFNDTPPETIIPGDADCDQDVDESDLPALLRRLFSELFRPGCKGADTNGDGVITAADLVPA
jgi:hypothetical protein